MAVVLVFGLCFWVILSNIVNTKLALLFPLECENTWMGRSRVTECP